MTEPDIQTLIGKVAEIDDATLDKLERLRFTFNTTRMSGGDISFPEWLAKLVSIDIKEIKEENNND